MSKFYANPYAGGRGFYFDDFDEYEKKAAKLQARGIEEWEIDFIDGDREDADLANEMIRAGLLDQGSVEAWFDQVEGLQVWEKAALYWWVGNAGNRDLEDGLQKVDCCLRVFEGEMKAYVEEYIDDIGGPSALGERMQDYFDFDAFGRDLRIDGYDHDPDTGEEIEHLASMSDRELGENYLEDFGEIPKNVAERYFDYDHFATEVETGGDAVEFDFAGRTWVMTTPHEA